MPFFISKFYNLYYNINYKKYIKGMYKMKNYKIVKDTLTNDIKNIILDIYKWNKSKNITLYTYNGDIFKKHFLLLHGFSETYVKENKTLNLTNISTNKLILNKDNNIFMALHYIEQDLKEPYLIIKEESLSKYINENDKILVFEYHGTLFDDFNIINKFYDICWELTCDYNFNNISS